MKTLIKYEDLKCEFCNGLGEREVNIDGADCPTVCTFCDETGIDQDQLEKLIAEMKDWICNQPFIRKSLMEDYKDDGLNSNYTDPEAGRESGWSV